MRNPRLLKIWANGDLDPCHRSRFWRTRQSRSKNDTVSILSILFQNQTGEPGKRISVSDPEVVPLSMMDSKIQGVGWINERRFQSKTLGSTQYINTWKHLRLILRWVIDSYFHNFTLVFGHDCKGNRSPFLRSSEQESCAKNQSWTLEASAIEKWSRFAPQNIRELSWSRKNIDSSPFPRTQISRCERPESCARSQSWVPEASGIEKWSHLGPQNTRELSGGRENIDFGPFSKVGIW